MYTYGSIIVIILTLVFLYIVSNTITENLNEQNNKISIILLNYKRPHNLHKSLPELSRYKLVDEIIVFHGHEDFYVEFHYPKVKNIIDYKDNIYGAAKRFFYTKYCKNDILLFIDDDILPTEDLINNTYSKLMDNYNKNTIYGTELRLCNNNGYHLKSHENMNIILTPFLMCKKKIIEDYMSQKNGFKKYEEWLAKYKGNCEDISLNIFINQFYNEKPIFVEGNIKHLDNLNGYSAKGNHYKIRNIFCKKYSNVI